MVGEIVVYTIFVDSKYLSMEKYVFTSLGVLTELFFLTRLFDVTLQLYVYLRHIYDILHGTVLYTYL